MCLQFTLTLQAFRLEVLFFFFLLFIVYISIWWIIESFPGLKGLIPWFVHLMFKEAHQCVDRWCERIWRPVGSYTGGRGGSQCQGFFCTAPKSNKIKISWYLIFWMVNGYFQHSLLQKFTNTSDNVFLMLLQILVLLMQLQKLLLIAYGNWH